MLMLLACFPDDFSEPQNLLWSEHKTLEQKQKAHESPTNFEMLMQKAVRGALREQEARSIRIGYN